MPIEHICPHCNQSLTINDDTADTQITCPGCGQVTSLPAATAADELALALQESPPATAPAVLDFGNPYQSPHSADTSDLHHRGGRRRRGDRQFATAERGERLLGAIVDGACTIAIALAGVFLSYRLEKMVGPSSQFLPMLAIFSFVAFNWYLIARDGESVGKKAAGTRIVTDDHEELPGFVRGVILRNWIPGFIKAIPIVGSVFAIVDVAWIFESEKRCVHDLIAGTRVVDVGSRRRRTKKVDLDFDPVQLNTASQAAPVTEPIP